MAPEKKYIYIDILELALVTFRLEANLFLEYTKIFLNITTGLYNIKLIAYKADYIF